MKIETTRTAGLVRLRHAVGFTASTNDVVAHAAPVSQRAGWSDEAPPSVRSGIDVEVRQVPAVGTNLAVGAVRRTDDIF